MTVARRHLRVALSLLVVAFASRAPGLSAQDVHVVLVTGLGGDPTYSDTFHEWSAQLRAGALEVGARPENIHWLAEDPSRAPDAIEGESRLENLSARMAALAADAGATDRILIVFIGHGTSRAGETTFNLPGPDVGPEEIGVMLDAFPTQTVAVVNTSPSSGPFVEALAQPGRIIVTATKTAREANETQFGRFFARAFQDGEADLDKDGRVSLLEAFRYSIREVERYYDEEGLLATEHAILDDDGDGVGSERPAADGLDVGGEEEARQGRPAETTGDAADDGLLAARFWLTPRDIAVTRAVAEAIPEGVTDPEVRRLYERRIEIEEAVADLRLKRDEMEADAYEAELERLLLELAVLNREIREKGGGI